MAEVLSIGVLSHDDFDRLREILADEAVCRGLCAGQADPQTAEQVFDEFTRPSVDEGSRLFVFRDASAGNIVGGVRVDDGEVAFFVDPRFWGRGVGKRMLRAAMQGLCREHGRTVYYAYCLPENRRSVAVLEGAGFRLFRRAGAQVRPFTVLEYRYVDRSTCRRMCAEDGLEAGSYQQARQKTG